MTNTPSPPERLHAVHIHRTARQLGAVFAAGDLLASIDPEALEIVAGEISGGHPAAAATLRGIARRQRAAVAKVESWA